MVILVLLSLAKSLLSVCFFFKKSCERLKGDQGSSSSQFSNLMTITITIAITI